MSESIFKKWLSKFLRANMRCSDCLVVCIRNQRPPLLEWEADVSEEFSWLQQFFLFSCLSFEHCLSPSPSLLLSLSLSLTAVYIHPVLSFFSFNFDTNCTWSYSYISVVTASFRWPVPSSPSRGSFFSGSPVQHLDTETLCPSDVNGGGKEWERERCSCDRGPFSVSQCGIWCDAWRWGLPRWQNPRSRLKVQDEAQLAALSACAALDGLQCCITLCTAVKGGWKAAVISLSSTLFPHSHTVLPEQSLYEKTTFHFTVDIPSAVMFHVWTRHDTIDI